MMDGQKYMMREPLVPMQVDPEDIKDGLSVQYHIPASIPSLPVGAAQVFEVVFAYTAKRKTIESHPLRLRFHTDAGYYDYPFSLLAGMDLGTAS